MERLALDGRVTVSNNGVLRCLPKGKDDLNLCWIRGGFLIVIAVVICLDEASGWIDFRQITVAGML